MRKTRAPRLFLCTTGRRTPPKRNDALLVLSLTRIKVFGGEGEAWRGRGPFLEKGASSPPQPPPLFPQRLSPLSNPYSTAQGLLKVSPQAIGINKKVSNTSLVEKCLLWREKKASERPCHKMWSTYFYNTMNIHGFLCSSLEWFHSWESSLIRYLEFQERKYQPIPITQPKKQTIPPLL